MMEGFTYQADKALLDTVFDGVVVIDLKHLRISLANKAAAKILGFNDPEELAGVDPLKHIPQEDAAHVSSLLSSVLSGVCLQEGIEVRVLDKRGKEIWITARGVKLASNGSSVLLATFRDITAQKTAEMALREAEEGQIHLLNSSNELILISQDWKVVFANRRLQEAMGLSEGALIGISILDLTHPDDRKAVEWQYQKMLDGKSLPSDRPFKGIGKDGKTSWGMMRHVPFTWQGSPALMTIVQDITQQKLAEEALQESERRYRLIADNITDVIWTLDTNLKTIYVSPSVTHQKGYTVEEAMGLTLEEQMSPETAAKIKSAIVEELVLEETGTADPHRSRTSEGETYRKDGSKLWVEITASFLRDQQGKPVGIMGVTRDITERKKAEEALRESEERYRLLAENASDVIWTTDMNLKYTYNSPSKLRQSGHTPEEFNRLTVDQVLTPESLEVAARVFQEELAIEQSPDRDPNRRRVLDLAEYHKDGSLIWTEATASFLRDKDGRPIGVIGISRDVTERKKAEKALRESEEKFKALVENSAAVVFSLDTQGNIMYISPAIEGLSGFKAEELTGTSCIQYVVPEDLPGLMASMEKTVAGEAEPYEFRVRHKNGTVHYILTSSRPIHRDGSLAGLIGVMVDVTERRVAEEALRTSEANYRNLFEHTLVGMEVVDAETMKVVLANHSIAKMFGFKSPQDMVGTEPLEYVLPEDLDWVVGELSKALADPNMHEVATLRVRTKDGRIIWVTGMTTYFDYVRRPSILISLVDVTEAKEAELKVAESEEKNRLLVENAAEGIIVIQDGMLRFANPKCTEISGYTTAELLSRPFLHFVHPDDRQMMTDNYVKRMAGEVIDNNYRFRMLDKAGGVRWLQINTVQFSWEGRPAVLSMLNDVTERRLAEEALRNSESRYRLIAENASDVIWTMGLNLQVTYVSPSIEKLAGLSVEEALSMKMEDVLTPASLQTAYQSYLRGLTDLERYGGIFTSPQTVELEMKRTDGSTVWTEVQMSFMQDEEGKVIGIMGVGRNIDERQRARQALVESEQRFRALIEGARDAIAVIDPRGRVTYASPSAEGMTASAFESVMTMSLQERVHPDDLGEVSGVFESLLSSPDGTVVDVELRYRRDDQSWGVVEVRGTNRVHDPKIGGIVVNYRDITERRQAQEDLAESESRYRLLAENVSDVIWSVSMKSKRAFFSPSVTRLLGYTPEEAQSMKMQEVVSPTSYSRAVTAFSKLSGKQGNGSDSRSASTQLEIELVRKDGSFVWVDISVTLLRDARGQPSELFGVMRDITQRKRVEEDLRTSEEYFRALIENAWDAIVIVSAEGTMLYESPSSARILGYEPEEIVGKNLSEFVRPEDVAAIADTFRRFRTEPGSIVMVDAGFRHKDGRYIECEGTLQNFLHDPKINGVVANYRDVTDRRRAEEAIRTSEERFRNLVEATSDWVWEVDPSGIYTYVSPRVREVMGYEVGEIAGKSMFDHMPARDSSRLARTFRAHAEKREPFAFLETSRQRKDGRVIVVETSGVPFFGEDGGLLGYRGIGRDITNRKKVEKDLENSLKKVEKTMEAAIQAISYTMETRDPYTTGHQRRVTQLACAIAKEIGVAPWQIDGIRVAGLLHDIGKIAVPTEILSKPGRLSDIEFSMIKAHPKVGFDILKNVEFEWPIARIVVQHHERLDGSGYPFGLSGKDILQESRILAVADVVEAMSSHRPYRPALGIDKALAEVVRGDGTLYDSEVVRACAKVIKERGFKFEG